MNRGSAPAGGYTIVETLIFLAVSSIMFVSAMLLIGGRQHKTEFVNAVRDFETKLTDVANNISTGYYHNVGNFTCSVPDEDKGPVLASAATGGLGEHGDCIFIGTVVKFGGMDGATDPENKEKFAVINMAGLKARTTTAGKVNVSSLEDARPKVIAPTINFVEKTKFGYGATIHSVTYGGSNTPAGAVGFFTTFQGASISKSGARQTQVLPYKDMLFTDNDGATGTRLNNNHVNATFGTNYNTAPINPPGGVTICLKSGGTKQYALIKLGGGTSGNLTVSSVIKNYSADSELCNDTP